ncbi:NAD-binding protein, partial [Paraburkholderia sp. SIMBA_027]|uniref:NAD-binding protein n=1 Tax=Paraburkholderia sp. SIMBA_027 TaxID=3085770 RepID=UPI00397E3755
MVLGGGVAGVELGQAFSRLGSEVAVVARGRLLSSYPEEAASLVLAGLRADGIDVRLHTDVAKVEKNDDGSITVTLDGKNLTA